MDIKLDVNSSFMREKWIFQIFFAMVSLFSPEKTVRLRDSQCELDVARFSKTRILGRQAAPYSSRLHFQNQERYTDIQKDRQGF